jgi:RNA polymerase sigma-70 factor (ECF subfamily)
MKSRFTQASQSLPLASALAIETPENAALSISGEPSTSAVLFQRYSRLVRGTAYRVLRDLNEAEDVVQEVFLYLHQKAKLFDPARGSVKAWILQIAVSRAIDRKIYLARRRLHAHPDLASLPLPEEKNLEQQIEAKLNRKRIERAFSELTYMQRRTIEFFYFEGLNLRDISEQLREPLGSVRHHFYRGLQRLRRSSAIHSLQRK